MAFSPYVLNMQIAVFAFLRVIMSPFDVKDARSARIGESARYFAANQPMRYGIEIVHSLEVEHCIHLFVYVVECWHRSSIDSENRNCT